MRVLVQLVLLGYAWPHTHWSIWCLLLLVVLTNEAHAEFKGRILDVMQGVRADLERALKLLEQDEPKKRWPADVQKPEVWTWDGSQIEKRN